MKEWINLKTD